ncbi:Alpha-2 adrenergic receptor [Eufriesea mexicana]|uniref:Alpha-2 adrenergic receptor n=1 Tax=Eufriesea mexicana TaxID=516756 RepID=A0A310SD97_9HYME|nr:Alpha-2 adrenergic receptor [Eufriesea mexicana]
MRGMMAARRGRGKTGKQNREEDESADMPQRRNSFLIVCPPFFIRGKRESAGQASSEGEKPRAVCELTKRKAETAARGRRVDERGKREMKESRPRTVVPCTPTGPPALNDETHSSDKLLRLAAKKQKEGKTIARQSGHSTFHPFLFQLSEDIGYVVYSALGSFYIPSCIMVFVYIRIYFAAKARARRGIRKQPRPRAVIPPESPDVRQTSFTQSTPATETKKPPGSVMENVATIENQPVQIPIVTCDFASDVSTSEADPGGGSSIPMEEKDTLKSTSRGLAPTSYGPSGQISQILTSPLDLAKCSLQKRFDHRTSINFKKHPTHRSRYFCIAPRQGCTSDENVPPPKTRTQYSRTDMGHGVPPRDSPGSGAAHKSGASKSPKAEIRYWISVSSHDCFLVQTESNKGAANRGHGALSLCRTVVPCTPTGPPALNDETHSSDKLLRLAAKKQKEGKTIARQSGHSTFHPFLFQLSEDIGYVVYSALGSFYIPSCIMVFVYIRIYFAAKARARRGIRKQPRPRAVIPPESPDVRQTSFTQSTPATETKKPPGSVMENVATIENQPVQIPIVTCDFASDVSTSEADPGGGSSIPMEEKDTLKSTSRGLAPTSYGPSGQISQILTSPLDLAKCSLQKRFDHRTSINFKKHPTHRSRYFCIAPRQGCTSDENVPPPKTRTQYSRTDMGHGVPWV